MVVKFHFQAISHSIYPLEKLGHIGSYGMTEFGEDDNNDNNSNSGRIAATVMTESLLSKSGNYQSSIKLAVLL